ncbi:hypothetical protein BC941DRAFT_428316 [Chlamydoabsidia padenii]|nr:hypothetical protein BC941DRAFT_428316 [Chlamydoabsidia padenii]
MSLEFKTGSYSVQTGKTFLDPTDTGHDFYTLRFNSKLDPNMSSRKATLRSDKDTYYADWVMSDNVLSYEGAKGNLQELECLLVFDEETQTFTLERPSIKMTMKKARKKKSSGSIRDSQQQSSSTSGKAPPTKIKTQPTTSTSIKKSSDWLTPPIDTTPQRSSPISLALPPSQPPPPPPPQKDTPTTTTTVPDDSFDFDLLRDMDEILNSNDEDEANDDDDDDDNDEFETITSPQAYIHSPQPASQQSPTLKRRRPALKMASAPIRRLDASPPTPAPQQANKRPRTGGKTISAETLAARRKAVSAIRSKSSSGSSSSSSSSDSDSDSNSSDSDSSGSSDSDSDMDDLADNISRGLSEEVSSYPAASSTVNLAPSHVAPAGPPRSLRGLLDGNPHDDDGISSSDDDG